MGSFLWLDCSGTGSILAISQDILRSNTPAKAISIEKDSYELQECGVMLGT
jgi:hypothetical protein